eukprot:GFYU01003487.1.p1 GENE.GFYU01003487.1~~GFYU01003487.1.p1  ORF type:complete len:226 (+),score=58.88 GFYU01003487.1:41-718(+)
MLNSVCTAIRAAAVAVMVAHLWAIHIEDEPLRMQTKAVPIVLLAVEVLIRSGLWTGYVWANALLFSAGGDVALLWDHNEYFFLAGLSLFLVAHLAYMIVFYQHGQKSMSPIVAVILAILGPFYVYTYLFPHLPEDLVIPVCVYATVICGMVFTSQRMGTSALLGAIIFAVSDAVLAFDKFVIEFKTARLIVMFTYYLAQLLISGSSTEETHTPRVKAQARKKKET